MTLSSRKTLVRNAALLFLLKGTDYLLPLLVFPFLVHTLGMERFGLLAFARAVIQYFIILTDYGFNFTGTRQIAIHREDAKETSQIFTTIIAVKLLLLVISAIGLAILVSSIPQIRREGLIFCLNFLIVISNVFFPVWFFQGMEKMGYVTMFNIIAKVLTSLLLFVFIRQPRDYQLAAFIQSSGFIVPGLLSMIVIKRNFCVQPVPIAFSNVVNHLKDSGKVFIGSFLGNIMTQGGVIIVGLMSGNAAAGSFSIAQKIASTLVSLIQPFEQVIYPHLCALYINEYKRYLAFRNRVVWMSVPITLLLSLLTFSCANLATRLVRADNSEDTLVLIIKIFSFTIIFTIFNVLLNSFILSMNRLREMSSIYIYSSILFLLISLPLTAKFSNTGMAISFFVTEAFIFWRSSKLVFKRVNN